jgi:hypothetical protein
MNKVLFYKFPGLKASLLPEPFIEEPHLIIALAPLLPNDVAPGLQHYEKKDDRPH